MPIAYVLDILDTALDAHIPSIPNHVEREQALILNRGIKSFKATASSGSEQVVTTGHILNAKSKTRIEAAISNARRQQIADAIYCLRTEELKEAISQPELDEESNVSPHAFMEHVGGCENVRVADVATAELFSGMLDLATRIAQLKGAIALATANYITVATSDMNAAIAAGYANPAVLCALVEELEKALEFSVDQAWVKGFDKGWESRSEISQ